MVYEVDTEQAIELLRQLIAIRCEPWREVYETEIAGFCGEKLKALGFEVERIEKVRGRPSVLARRRGRGGGKFILFNGHLMSPSSELDDWTHPPYEGEIEDGKLYGVGAADMRGAIAAMIQAVILFDRSGREPKGDIVFALGAGGEGGGVIGTRFMVERGVRADMAIVGEPTELHLVTMERGAVWMELHTQGRTGLTGVPGGLNALHKMIDVLAALKALNGHLNRKTHPLLGRSEISANFIQAGTEIYNIPNRCTARVDRRLLLSERTDNAIAEIEGVLNALRDRDPEVDLESRVLLAFEPAEISPDEEIVRFAREAIREVRGREPEIRGIFGYTEAVHLIETGIPALILGPGSTKVIHAPDEFIPLDDYLDAIRIYARILERVIGGVSL